jgi:hypothetical protein
MRGRWGIFCSPFYISSQQLIIFSFLSTPIKATVISQPPDWIWRCHLHPPHTNSNRKQVLWLLPIFYIIFPEACEFTFWIKKSPSLVQISHFCELGCWVGVIPCRVGVIPVFHLSLGKRWNRQEWPSDPFSISSYRVVSCLSFFAYLIVELIVQCSVK